MLCLISRATVQHGSWNGPAGNDFDVLLFQDFPETLEETVQLVKSELASCRSGRVIIFIDALNQVLTQWIITADKHKLCCIFYV